jgi:Caspase recruitment domain
MNDAVFTTFTGLMDALYSEVLLEQRQAIVKSADPNDVLLNHLLNHLRSKRCLILSQEERIRSNVVSSDRIGCLLDFLSSEGQKAFDELCNALEDFGTEDKQKLSESLRQCFREKQCPGKSSWI